MKAFIQITVLFFCMVCYCQTEDSLYLEYNEKMNISDIKENLTISFDIIDSEKINNRYNFKVDNIGKDFELKNFSDLKNSIKKEQLKEIKLTSVKVLSEMSSCDLHYRLSNLKSIFLVKKVGNTFYKYNLQYWSTQRGWSTVKSN